MNQQYASKQPKAGVTRAHVARVVNHYKAHYEDAWHVAVTLYHIWSLVPRPRVQQDRGFFQANHKEL